MKLASDPTVHRLLVGVLMLGGGEPDLVHLITALQQGGLQGQIGSWVDLGANRPVTPEQMRDALGADTVDRVAAEAGISPEEAAAKLSVVLPQLIDDATPSGALPDNTSLQEAMDNLVNPDGEPGR